MGGLLNRCSEDELLDYFASMGDVTDVMIPVDRESNTAKGFGFVVFAEEAAALKVRLSCSPACFFTASTLCRPRVVTLVHVCACGQAIDECNGQSVAGVSHKVLSLRMAEKSRVQLEWEEKTPAEARPAVEPRSRSAKDSGQGRAATEGAGGMNGEAAGHEDTEALPKRVKEAKKVEDPPRVIVANVENSDVPQVCPALSLHACRAQEQTG